MTPETNYFGMYKEALLKKLAYHDNLAIPGNDQIASPTN